MKLTVLLLLVSVGLSAAVDCDTSDIACSNGEKCIPQRYICDSDNDCTDASDEDAELCSAWKNSKCDRNSVECFRNGETKCIEISEYCRSEAPACDGSLDRRICLMLAGQRIDKLSNFTLPDDAPGNLNRSNELANRFRSILPNTISHESCPTLYTLVGDQCLSVFYIGSVSWGEARAFCKVLGGDLLTFKNISQFADIVQHLQRYELSSSFWIGGSVTNDTEGWTWIDGSPMEMGTPFWATRYSGNCVNRNVTTAKSEATCYHYYQSPEAVPSGECASLSFEHSYYISDEDCLRKMSPLCVYQGTDFPKRTGF
ncbi:uncharacterized protein LOC135207921 [Macrobrachium nipponense]|uniref:uncharacterized protein LOC135207921 n=1 Tax=Macrobrachium nipponense TaxID=159736 RepID=UPI0030C7A846